MPSKPEHCVFPNGESLLKKDEEVGKHGAIDTIPENSGRTEERPVLSRSFSSFLGEKNRKNKN